MAASLHGTSIYVNIKHLLLAKKTTRVIYLAYTVTTGVSIKRIPFDGCSFFSLAGTPHQSILASLCHSAAELFPAGRLV